MARRAEVANLDRAGCHERGGGEADRGLRRDGAQAGGHEAAGGRAGDGSCAGGRGRAGGGRRRAGGARADRARPGGVPEVDEGELAEQSE
jgi:hypothetical protein